MTRRERQAGGDRHPLRLAALARAEVAAAAGLRPADPQQGRQEVTKPLQARHQETPAAAQLCLKQETPMTKRCLRQKLRCVRGCVPRWLGNFVDPRPLWGQTLHPASRRWERRVCCGVGWAPSLHKPSHNHDIRRTSRFTVTGGCMTEHACQRTAERPPTVVRPLASGTSPTLRGTSPYQRYVASGRLPNGPGSAGVKGQEWNSSGWLKATAGLSRPRRSFPAMVSGWRWPRKSVPPARSVNPALSTPLTTGLTMGCGAVHQNVSVGGSSVTATGGPAQQDNVGTPLRMRPAPTSVRKTTQGTVCLPAPDSGRPAIGGLNNCSRDGQQSQGERQQVWKRGRYPETVRNRW